MKRSSCSLGTLAWLALASASPVVAERVSVGIKAGVPFTGYFETGRYGSLHGDAEYSAATRRYVVGASVEWRMTNAFGLEADVLYHRMGYTALVREFNQGDFKNASIDVKGSSWDFPILRKRSFGRGIRPYVAGGGVVRYVGPVRGRGQQTVGNLVSGSSATTPIDTSDPSELRKRWYPGVTAAAGVEFRAGRVRLAPEIRYTHWTANISGPDGLLRFAPNEVQFLAGVSF
jgi:hypothetical protein